MSLGAARERPAVFSALIVLGAVLTAVVTIAGRTLATELLVAAYLAFFVLAILRQAASDPP